MYTIKTDKGCVEYARFAGTQCEAVGYGQSSVFTFQQMCGIKTLLKKLKIKHSIIKSK